MKVAISTSSFASQDSAPLDYLKDKKIEIYENPFSRKLNEIEIIDHLVDMDGLIAGLEPLNYKVLSRASKLKAISRVGIGLDNVDLKAAEKLGIKVKNTPDAPTDAVAEMTLTACLALMRSILIPNLKLHKKIWNKSIGRSLNSSNIFIIGYGRIGRKTAELFLKMNAKILVYDPYINQKDLILGERLVKFNEGLQLADVISLHADSKDTVLSTSEFNLMKKGVILLNSSRGNLVNEESLIAALDDGIVSSGWFDVYCEEPYKGMLTEYDQLLLTPHMSTYTIQCRREMEMDAVINLCKILGI